MYATSDQHSRITMRKATVAEKLQLQLQDIFFANGPKLCELALYSVYLRCHRGADTFFSKAPCISILRLCNVTSLLLPAALSPFAISFFDYLSFVTRYVIWYSLVIFFVKTILILTLLFMIASNMCLFTR